MIYMEWFITTNDKVSTTFHVQRVLVHSGYHFNTDNAIEFLQKMGQDWIRQDKDNDQD